MKIEYVTGDATLPLKNGKSTTEVTKVICHICNNVGAWGAGFVVALSRRFGDRFTEGSPENMYRAWATERKTKDGSPFELGHMQLTKVELDHDSVSFGYVCNMIAQKETSPQVFRGFQLNMPLVRYDALHECFERLRIALANAPLPAELHMPRIGCGIAGGKWEKIEAVLNEVFGTGFDDMVIYVYDFNPGGSQ